MKAALSLICVFLASCASLQPSARTALVGEWRYVDNTQSCHYSFKRDGTFSGEVTLGRQTVSRFTGRWEVKGDLLLYKYVSDALGRIPAGATDQDKLLAVKKDSFLIEAADGNQRRYLRQPPRA